MLFIRRRKQYGRSIPDDVIKKLGCDEMYVDVKRSLMETLCTLAKYDVHVVPYGSELAFPIVLAKPAVALLNDFQSDVFYHEAMVVYGARIAGLYVDSVPVPWKPKHVYYNDFHPTADQIRRIGELVRLNTTTDTLFDWKPHAPRDVKNENSLIEEVRIARATYLQKAQKQASVSGDVNGKL